MYNLRDKDAINSVEDKTGGDMEIHNIVEDIVLDTVDQSYNELLKKGGPNLPCACAQCRLDTAAYVLNRVNPQYIVSSRGVERAEDINLERQQVEADIARLVFEGIQKIAHARRPHFKHNSSAETVENLPKGPVFNFPAIVGRVFNGLNFEPLAKVELTFFNGNEIAPMINPSWQNPYTLVSNSGGTYSFWPEPVKAREQGEERDFACSIKASSEGYESVNHFFDMKITSEERASTSYSMQRSLKLADIYLFPEAYDENIDS